tara:strand:+ start:5680 stop:6030 length:351 start_codon:yes stop_codon:yes gene_type:complete
MRKQKDESLLTDTLTHINSAVTNIYTNIDRDDCLATPEQRELVDTFNKLVTLEQKIIDMLHPKRHEEGKLPNPKYLEIERSTGLNSITYMIKERQENYSKSEHWYHKMQELLEYES